MTRQYVNTYHTQYIRMENDKKRSSTHKNQQGAHTPQPHEAAPIQTSMWVYVEDPHTHI